MDDPTPRPKKDRAIGVRSSGLLFPSKSPTFLSAEFDLPEFLLRTFGNTTT